MSDEPGGNYVAKPAECPARPGWNSRQAPTTEWRLDDCQRASRQRSSLAPSSAAQVRMPSVPARLNETGAELSTMFPEPRNSAPPTSLNSAFTRPASLTATRMASERSATLRNCS